VPTRRATAARVLGGVADCEAEGGV
jgi:hypothetical protein